ncbi:MAG TPA: hypothetical protein VM901_11645 [Bdellovibrionota bacterium]|nr:hypothetical protein [Bdellovibrionota bacterium]
MSQILLVLMALCVSSLATARDPGSPFLKPSIFFRIEKTEELAERYPEVESEWARLIAIYPQHNSHFHSQREMQDMAGSLARLYATALDMRNRLISEPPASTPFVDEATMLRESFESLHSIVLKGAQKARPWHQYFKVFDSVAIPNRFTEAFFHELSFHVRVPRTNRDLWMRSHLQPVPLSIAAFETRNGTYEALETYKSWLRDLSHSSDLRELFVAQSERLLHAAEVIAPPKEERVSLPADAKVLSYVLTGITEVFNLALHYHVNPREIALRGHFAQFHMQNQVDLIANLDNLRASPQLAWEFVERHTSLSGDGPVRRRKRDIFGQHDIVQLIHHLTQNGMHLIVESHVYKDPVMSPELKTSGAQDIEVKIQISAESKAPVRVGGPSSNTFMALGTEFHTVAYFRTLVIDDRPETDDFIRDLILEKLEAIPPTLEEIKAVSAGIGSRCTELVARITHP